MPFEKFIPARKQKPPQASLKRTGTISLDIGFTRQFGLAEARAVTLYFEAQKRLIGIRSADPKEEGAMRLSHRSRVASVRARPFFQAYGITLEKTTHVPLSFDEAEGMIVIPLPSGGRRPRGRPRKTT